MNNLEQIARELAHSVPPDELYFYEKLTKNITKALRSVAPPDGWVMVPVEPTQEMYHKIKMALPVETRAWFEDGKMHCTILLEHECVDPNDVYRAMLKAAPKPPEDK